MLIKCLLMTLIGFLSGSLMYSYLIPKVFLHVDVRAARPDSNPGGANAIHAAGLAIGLLCILLDVVKAFVPVLVSVMAVQVAGFWLVPVTMAPVLGHAFSPMLGFRGGKAVASAFGALLGLWPVSRIVLLLALTTVLFRFVIALRPDSFCVSVSLLAACIITPFLESQGAVWVALAGVSAVVLCKQALRPDPGRKAIRLLRGEWHERRSA